MSFRKAMRHERTGAAKRLLLAFALLLAAAALPAQSFAQTIDCNDAPYNGLVDGNVYPNLPAQLTIDADCTIRNYPQSNPLDVNISFNAPGGGAYLVIFDNVRHIGQMSCNSNDTHEHKIWFVNSSGSNIHASCRELFIPVEKIDKDSPGPAASIGVPFTYTLTIPVLFDPNGGIVVDDQGSQNDLHAVTVWDDLNETGVDMSYVSHTVRWESSGAPVQHTFTNVGDLLTFELDSPGLDVPAGEQFVIEITVVLEDTPANAPGTQFVNTAKWDFGRLIEGTFYEPLPGEWGISQPMTIAAPALVVTKTGPATLGRTLNLGQWGQFGVDVHNTGLTPAWDVRILDRLPDGPTGGMCDQVPEILSARVFAADGVTAVTGKGPLVAGTDYTLSYNDAPVCELTLTMRTAAASIGPDERLVVSYRTRLDADTADGIALTNVVASTQWFNDDDSNTARIGYVRTLTNGTVGVPDHEDAHTVTTALYGFFFEKSVVNLTSGASPATTAEPGDVLRYTLRLQSTDVQLDDLAFTDDLGSMNPSAVFVPGSLTLVGSLPPGANGSATNPSGGTNGAGVLDIRNLDLPAASEVSIQFDITLAAAIQNGTVVTNQADLLGVGNVKLADSDDPNVNGQSDPDVAGDEDPTRVTISSAPYFDIDKISADIDGDATLLLAGERLQYTITVRNIGTSTATDAILRDAVPANTTYVAGSTTLNGGPVADGAGGTSPLVNGMQLSTPGALTPGLMPVSSASAPAQEDTATVAFVVRVNADVIDGTIISNQGFVSAVAGGVLDRPSDDPRTPTLDDPTRDVVGDLPFLFAVKSAALQVDATSPGIVDPGDVLRYTITIYNNGRQPATEVVLRDTVPANTTYVADTLTLNGLPVGRPDGGTSPLVAGVSVSSGDLTPPLPGAGQGTLTEGQSAVLTFDLLVENGVPPGTLIVNQAVVDTFELPNLLTDGDGNPATGPEPTVVVVGDVQQLRITKNVSVVGGGPALAGATLEYVVQATNIGAVPAYQVVVRDDLDATPGQLTYVAGSATLNGSANGVVTGQLITANYSTVYGPLEPGRTVTLRFRATLYASLAVGTRVTNTGTVYWNDPVQNASASVSIDVGGIPGVGLVNGRVWHDSDFDRIFDADEIELANWDVELLFNGSVAHVARTAADGVYRMSGVMPNYGTTDTYELRFRRPGAGARTALLGRADSEFTDELQRITDIVVLSGSNLQNLNLPIDPNGIVYDAISRASIAGATVSLVAPGSGAALPSSCFYDVNQQGQVTLGDGYYKFDLNFADPACPSGGAYVLSVTPPSTRYLAQVSTIIPPLSSATTAAFAVPSCPASIDDAVPATAQHCESTTSQLQPPPSTMAGTAGTSYRLHLTFDDSLVPGSSQIYNNHIPLDLDLDESISVTKTTPLVHVSRGQLVPYIITLTNGVGVSLPNVTIVDRFPAGFRYVEGSARLDGVATEPTLTGRELSWSGLTVTPDNRHELKLLLAVGSGVGEGEFVNRAQAMSALTGGAVSAEASARVRIVPDPALDCTDVIGKVFDDENRNGLQDEGEAGIPGVRLATARGLLATTDQFGRYHITCAITPHEGRGSNFVLKLDDRTLPSGYRGSTQSLQVQRATRGKMLELSFGASIHRVIGLDLADAVFEPGSIEIRELWQPRLDLLLQELRAAPSVLRLSYLADLEDRQLVDARVKTMRRYIENAWIEGAGEAGPSYELAIEPEVFWRRDEPTGARERRRGNRE
jgi:uncharacterized repeat protein (TIGR01451 family)